MFTFDKTLRPFDALDYQQLALALERRQQRGQDAGSIVTVYAKNGVALMGFVPHTVTAPPVSLTVQNAFFNPYLKN